MRMFGMGQRNEIGGREHLICDPSWSKLVPRRSHCLDGDFARLLRSLAGSRVDSASRGSRLSRDLGLQRAANDLWCSLLYGSK